MIIYDTFRPAFCRNNVIGDVTMCYIMILSMI